MKFTAIILALVAAASAASVEQKSIAHYTYEDIREQELKCKADRNREWKYDAATNTWACPLQKYWVASITIVITQESSEEKVDQWINQKIIFCWLVAIIVALPSYLRPIHTQM